MKFETLAGSNPTDKRKVVGKPVDRIEGPLKTTGTAKYAYENNEVVQTPAYGYIVGAAIAKGRINSIDQTAAKAAPGVLAIVTAANAGPLQPGKFYVDKLLAGPEIDHYHQAVAVVVAETFEQARAAGTVAPAAASPTYAPSAPSRSTGSITRRSTSSGGTSSGTYNPAPAPTSGTTTIKHTERDAKIGAVAGAVIGATTSKNKVKGAIVGGVIGAAAGAVIGNNVDKKKVKK